MTSVNSMVADEHMRIPWDIQDADGKRKVL